MFDQIALGGIGFAVLAAAAYGFAGVAIAQGKPVARGDNGVYLSALVTALGTGLLWMGFGRVQLARLLDPGSVGTVAIFAAAGVFSTVLGRATLYRATERIGAVRASLLRRLTPVFTLPLALLLLAEVPGPRALVGAAIDRSISTGVLARDEPQPSRHVAPVVKVMPVPDRGNDGGRSFGSHAPYSPHPLTSLARAEDLIDAPVKLLNVLIDPGHQFQQE